MARFHLTITWRIPASIETSWFSIVDLKAWPDWWKYIESVVEIEQEDNSGINTLHQFNWTTCLPYQFIFELRTTHIIPSQLITFGSYGDLNGSGCCKLSQKNNFTIIQFEWDVQTNKPWTSIAATLFQPIFE